MWNWLPNFLNLWPAALAAAIAIPALLILYFLKLRRREMPVSSTLLWKKAIQDLQVNAPFQKLRRNLLLLLQMLLLCLLLLALARPIVNFTPGAGDLTVILIDRSASMSARDIDDGNATRLDEAKRRAKELIGTLDRGASAMVIAFDDSATTVQPFTTDALKLRQAIDSIEPTDRKSRLKLAYQLAEAQSNFNPEQLRSTVMPQVWVFSDGRVLDSQELSIRGEIKYDRIGSNSAPNIGVVALSAKRNYERPTEVQVFARLANYGPEPAKADVQLIVDGQVRSIASTTLVPERWTDAQRAAAEKDQGISPRESVEFKIDLTASAVVRVEQLNKQNDVFAADDSAAVVVPPPKNLAVLLVTDGNYFLEKILSSLKLKEPKTMTPAEYEQNVPANFDVIVFDRHVPQQLPPAGSFVYFASAPNGLKLAAAKENDKMVVMPGQTGVLDWKRDHPILRHLALTKLYMLDPIKLVVPLESEVLVDGMKGPLIVLHREGAGTHLVVAFDVLQSNWPFLVSWPVFMHNAMQFLALGSDMDVRQSLEPGATPRIPRANLQRAGAGDDAMLKRVRLNGPAGSRDIEIPETGDFALPPLNEVGVYELDPPIAPFDRIAVNLLDATESNLLPADSPPGGLGEAIAQSGGKSRLDLWWWIIACAALPLLLIEWWVYTRRVHL